MQWDLRSKPKSGGAVKGCFFSEEQKLEVKEKKTVVRNDCLHVLDTSH